MRAVAYRILFLALIPGAGCGVGDSHVRIAIRAAETEPGRGIEEMRLYYAAERES